MVDLMQLAEQGWIPQPLMRFGIRRLLSQRLAEAAAVSEASEDRSSASDRRSASWQDQFGSGPICIDTAAANAQHYEVPAFFYQRVLGPHLKYSCGWWDSEDTTLEESELRMLELTAERAQLDQGQRVLDLGCGWGAFSLWAAQRYPDSQFLAVSNSPTQRDFITELAARRRLTNLQVQTQDVAQLQLDRQFDRIVSIEMFEHMRNYRELLARLRSLLLPDGRLFVHIFCHRQLAYPFEVRRSDGNTQHDWMARHFFTGGVMPSRDLLSQFSEHLAIERQWDVAGTHYQRTAESWLRNLDAYRPQLEEVLALGEGVREGRVRVNRWRIFFLSCAELFGFRRGQEWFVTHLRMCPV